MFTVRQYRFRRIAIRVTVTVITCMMFGCEDGGKQRPQVEDGPLISRDQSDEGGSGQSSNTAVALTAKDEPSASNVRSDGYIERLIAAGWDRRAAESVVELNAEWFDIQAAENPGGLEIQLKLLAALGEYRDLHGFIADHPETAGLLAAAGNPRLVADSLRVADNNGEYFRMSGLYVQHADPHDAASLALALKSNQDLICALHRRGLWGSEAIFIFDRDEAGNAYEMWLRDAISGKLAVSDDDLAGFLNLVMRHGTAIRERMRDDNDFRRRFRSDLWPKLARVVASQEGAFEHYLDEPRVWDLLALDNGEELLKRCGLVAIDLLYGYPEIDHPAYPKPLHDEIIQILLRREELPIHSLMKFRHEPAFHRLLQRSVSLETRSAALAKLVQAGPNYPSTLAFYDRLSDSALAEEVGPTPSGPLTWVPLYYTVYEVPKKLLQGREPTWMDLFSAAADAIFIVPDLFSGGQTAVARKALVAGGRKAAERAALKLAEKGAEKVFVTTLRDTGLELAKKRLGREVATRLSERELVNWSVSGLLSQMQQAVVSTVGKATTFEITKPVQFMFQYAGAGRQTWRRLTNLEARLFMRGDAKVFVRVANVPVAVLGTRGAALLNQTAEDLSIGAAAESEPGQEVLRSVFEKAISARDQLIAWQKNVSAWWLHHASAIDHNERSSPRQDGVEQGTE